MGVARAIDAVKRLVRRALMRAGTGVLVCAVLATPAAASDLVLVEQSPASRTVHTPLDKTVSLHAEGPVGRVVVSQPEIVEVGLAGPRELYVIGRELGSANLLVYDRQGRLSQTLDIQVGYDAEGLRETLAAALPEEKVTVTGLATALMVEGEVSSPAAAAAVDALAERAAPESVISRLHVKSGVVRVDVRIVEASSRRLRELGAGLSADSPEFGIAVRDLPIGVSPPHMTARLDTRIGGYRLDAALRGLEETGDARVVAQPTLVTVSGERATFRAGGELPYPVPQDQGKVTVEFRPYGAGLTIQPTIQANGLIRIEVDAELSQIDPQNKVTFEGVQVPALLTRRATTTAELRDGQTFIIAGLFEQGRERQARQSPGLAAAPLIGPLLRSLRAKDTRRELAIIVTPHIGAEAPPTLEAVKASVDGPPPQPAVDATPRTPKSVAAPRGPPVRALVRDLRQALTPPVRWVKHVAQRFVRAVTARA